MAIETITIQVECKNAFEKSEITETLNKVAKLSSGDRSRIAELSGSAKALKTLESKWSMLKMMFT